VSAHRPANLRFCVIFLSPTRQMLIQYFKRGNSHFISHPFQNFIFYCHSLWYDLSCIACPNKCLIHHTCLLYLNVSKPFPHLLYIFPVTANVIQTIRIYITFLCYTWQCIWKYVCVCNFNLQCRSRRIYIMNCEIGVSKYKSELFCWVWWRRGVGAFCVGTYIL
jgi:hypothetical protein